MGGLTKAWHKLTGKYDRDKANQLAEAEYARQQAIKNQMKEELSGITDDLKRKQSDYLNAVLGANSTSNAYLNNYLANLNGLADLNYNQGLTSLYRNISNTEKTIRNQMANRGISGAGVDFRNLVNSQGALARGISALQAQRTRDKAETAQTKYAAAANNANNNFSRLNSYYNYNPQMLQSQQAYMNLMASDLETPQATQQKIQQYQQKAANPILGSVAQAVGGALTGNILGAAGGLIGGLFGKKGSSSSGVSSGGSTGTSLFGNSGYNNDYLRLDNPVSVFQTPNYLGNTAYYNPYSDYAYSSYIPDYQFNLRY